MAEWVLFRVNAGQRIGLGHLMRCSVLAGELQARGWQCLWLVNAEATPWIREHAGVDDWVALPAEMSTPEEARWLRSQARRVKAHLIVLDGYSFDGDYRLAVREGGIPLVVFDDLNRSGPLNADFVLNASPAAPTLGYEGTAGDAGCLLGPDYALLRPQFRMTEHSPWQQREELLVTFGGTDPAGLTLETLEWLADSEITAPLTLVTGAGFAQVREVNEQIAAASGLIRHEHVVDNMAALMNRARMAVSAAGSTAFELAMMGVPALLVVVADNQWESALALARQGVCEIIDARAGLAENTLRQQTERLWQDEETLSRMSRKGQTLFDGRGAWRLAQALIG